MNDIPSNPSAVIPHMLAPSVVQLCEALKRASKNVFPALSVYHRLEHENMRQASISEAFSIGQAATSRMLRCMVASGLIRAVGQTTSGANIYKAVPLADLDGVRLRDFTAMFDAQAQVLEWRTTCRERYGVDTRILR